MSDLFSGITNLFGGDNDLLVLLRKHEIEEVHDNLIGLGVKNARDCAELEEPDIQNMDVPLVTKKKLYKIMTEAKTLRAVNAGAPIPTFGPGTFTQTQPVAPAGIPDPLQQPITSEWGGTRPLQHAGSFGMQGGVGGMPNQGGMPNMHAPPMPGGQGAPPMPGVQPPSTVPDAPDDSANTPDDDGLTPLHHAAKKGDHEAIEDLIKRGANLDVQTNDGKTALMISTEGGFEDCCELLLDEKADPNLTNKKGWTALFFAQDTKRPAIIKLLSKNEAKLNVQTSQGWTALMSAAFQGKQEEVVEILKAKADTNLKHENGMAALSLAASQGHSECCEFLLMKKAEVNAKSPQGSALMVAAQDGHLQVIKVLLDAGADAKDVDAQGNNAFKIAKKEGKTDAANLLKGPSGGGGCGCAVA